MKRLLVILLVFGAAHAFIVSGETTLSSASGLDSIGFIFKSATVTGNEGDIYYYDGELWTNHPTAGIKKMAGDTTTCDLEGYALNSPVNIGDIFCIRTQEGSYAKITILDKTSLSLTFSWAHQRDSSNLFVTDNQGSQGFNVNYLLIGLIVVLLIIIILLWKFR